MFYWRCSASSILSPKPLFRLQTCCPNYWKYHHSKETQNFIKTEKGSEKGGIIMAVLPPYLPEFNLDEQIWSHAKARLSQLSIASKVAMKDALTWILCSI